MSLLFSGFLLALFGLSLILITLSLRFLRTTAPGESYSSGARFFLICLRLAIGWHCFVEGMEKVTSPTWSSETYLRESVGPLSDVYRSAAGDRLIAKVTLDSDDEIPAELDREWQNYFDAFVAYYNLNAEQRQRASGILEQRRSDALTYLRSKSEVTKIAHYPPDLKLDMTMQQRLGEHNRLVARVHEIEAKFPTTDKDVHAEWKTAKADLARWRGEIKKSIDIHTAKLKSIDEMMRTKTKKTIDDLTEKMKNTKDAKAAAKLKTEIDVESAKLWEPLTDVLTSEQRERGPMPEPIVVPVSKWRLLEYSDCGVKWGLVVLGGCLMLGFLSRVSSLATAVLILTFYLAMPPLPGWPESPRLEGHYLLVNKTLIEVIALLALTFVPTGRWAGLDGLLCAFFCSSAKPTPE